MSFGTSSVAHSGVAIIRVRPPLRSPLEENVSVRFLYKPNVTPLKICSLKMINFIRERGPKGVVYFISLFVPKIKSNKRISLSLSHSVQGLVGLQVT